MQFVGATFDFERFYGALDGVRLRRRVAWRRVAADAGVSASCITRLSRGSRPDVDTIAALSGWAGLDLNDFVEAPSGGDYLTKATAYIRRDPSLTSEEALALEQILSVTYSSLKSRAPLEKSDDR
jgi:hypothetical protein